MSQTFDQLHETNGALAEEVMALRARVAELESAVLAEREACARILDSVNNYDNPMTAGDCADAIRARGEGK